MLEQTMAASTMEARAVDTMAEPTKAAGVKVDFTAAKIEDGLKFRA